MPHGKVMIIRLTVGLIRKMLLNEILLNSIPLYKLSQYFPKPYASFEGDISVKLDLSKKDLKEGGGGEMSNLKSWNR